MMAETLKAFTDAIVAMKNIPENQVENTLHSKDNVPMRQTLYQMNESFISICPSCQFEHPDIQSKLDGIGIYTHKLNDMDWNERMRKSLGVYKLATGLVFAVPIIAFVSGLFVGKMVWKPRSNMR
jgi:hypothetical protein